MYFGELNLVLSHSVKRGVSTSYGTHVYIDVGGMEGELHSITYFVEVGLL